MAVPAPPADLIATNHEAAADSAPQLDQSLCQQSHHQFAFEITLLERLAQAAAIVDASARLIYANAVARRLLAEADGLRLERDSRVSLEGAACHRRWLGFIARTSSGPAGTAGEALLLERPSGKPALQVFATRSPQAPSAETMCSSLALLIVRDPTLRHPELRQRLQEAYRLTDRESEVLERLAAGNSLTNLAADLGVGRETARTHLQRIFQKTGCRRQSELAHLVSGSPFAHLR